MGVHGLWDLLAPVGRRVSVETLSGKTLAIDASIWMVQFMKAMRDEKGEMIHNAHLLGFFRRICKLLYLRTKPIFVFDGATPALKRKTVIARRRQRDNAQAKIRKTAEKLLLNQLKSVRLQELAKNLENQRKNQKKDAKGKKTSLDQESNQKKNQVARKSCDQEKLDENLAASLAMGDDADGEEDKRLDTSKLNNNSKGKEILLDQTGTDGTNLERDQMVEQGFSQEELYEMFAASILVDGDRSLTGDVSTSSAAIHCEEDEDEDEEMILPLHGKLDPTVLAALPMSMQLDLLVQMRERLMAENRLQYQKVKKAPEKFSELQIQSYLKTVAFRREIDQMQKAAAGKDIGGVQTSRIASEANREFIFSSSFMGDKQSLASAGPKKNGVEQQGASTGISLDSASGVASASKSKSVAQMMPDQSHRDFDNDVGTYLDEMGRLRVSRVRALGMRMTRDLQRNLDLMKETDQERTDLNQSTAAQSTASRNEISVPKRCMNQRSESSIEDNCNSISLNRENDQLLTKDDTSVQISFKVGGEGNCSDSDDDIFASLVAGKSMRNVSTHDISGRPSCDSGSSSDWEEGTIGHNGTCLPNDLTSSLSFKRNIEADSEVEWEDGLGDVARRSPHRADLGKNVSRSYLFEEADLQEAIRRSLADIGNEKCNDEILKNNKSKIHVENADESVSFLHQDNNNDGGTEQKESSLGTFEVAMLEKTVGATQGNFSQPFFSPGSRSTPIDSCEVDDLDHHSEPSSQDASKHEKNKEIQSYSSVCLPEGKETHLIGDPSSDTFVRNAGLSNPANLSSRDGPGSCKTVSSDLLDILVDDSIIEKIELSEGVAHEKAETPCRSVDMAKPTTPLTVPSTKATNGFSVGQTLAVEDVNGQNDQRENSEVHSTLMNDRNVQDFMVPDLDQEIEMLDQEFIQLGNVQRKLERDAESVSNEMFAECQELLQMFGLPYIIAPMEAEAQCAYMELANLVDGVVTDDSDVFLFGGCSVYKNIFDDRKYVETYFMKDIEMELGLTREKLICMALLLGSDYTEGVSGIGIVNAIEVVNAFPEEDGLRRFREWVESPDPSILGKFDVQLASSMNKAEEKDGDPGLHCSSTDTLCEEKPSDADVQETKQIFMDTHRNVSKNWHIPPSFPSEAVISAYSSPQVDRSTDPFTWGKPDLHVLRRLCWEKFGWGAQKSDELLQPVLKEYNKRETQLRLEAFYTFNERFAKIRSNRIKKAVKGVTGKLSSDLTIDSVEEVSSSRKKRTIPDESSDHPVEKPSKRQQRICKGKSLGRSDKKQSSKKSISEESVLPEVELSEQQHDVNLHSNKILSRNGRARGRGRRRGGGRGRGKGELASELSDSSLVDDTNNSDGDEEDIVEKSGPHIEVRRSMRQRKPASYAEIDMETDDATNSMNESDEERSCLPEQQLFSSEAVGGEATKAVNPAEQHETETFEMEGGFCVDAGIGEHVGGSHDDPFQADASKDFLKMGGGFCTEDNEDRETACSPRIPDDFTNISCFLQEADLDSSLVEPTSHTEGPQNELQDRENNDGDAHEVVTAFANQIAPVNASKVGETLVDSCGNDAAASSSLGLSAMPFLKRKRRG